MTEAEFHDLQDKAHDLFIKVHHYGRTDVTDQPPDVLGMAYGHLHPVATVTFEDGRVFLSASRQ